MTATVDRSISSVVCEECDKAIGEHGCPGVSGGHVAVVATRSTGPRKAASAHPACPHCGGRIHWNDAGGKVNFECLFRQYLVDMGDITDPLNQKLPVATDASIVMLGEWIQSQHVSGTVLRYGKMESSGGGAATYSALRPKKAVLAPGTAIEDMAAASVPVSEAALEAEAARANELLTARAAALGFPPPLVPEVAEQVAEQQRKEKSPEEIAAFNAKEAERKREERARKRRELLGQTRR